MSKETVHHLYIIIDSVSTVYLTIFIVKLGSRSNPLQVNCQEIITIHSQNLNRTLKLEAITATSCTSCTVDSPIPVIWDINYPKIIQGV